MCVYVRVYERERERGWGQGGREREKSPSRLSVGRNFWLRSPLKAHQYSLYLLSTCDLLMEPIVVIFYTRKVDVGRYWIFSQGDPSSSSRHHLSSPL